MNERLSVLNNGEGRSMNNPSLQPMDEVRTHGIE